jgi:y4mF family transcriptional regulator
MQSHGNPAKTLARAIRAQRKSLRITQKQVALLAGCGPDFIYDLENGKPTLRFDKVLQVLSVIGLELVVRRGKQGVAVDEALAEDR